MACWGSEFGSGYGHVALVYDVDDTYIYVVEQSSNKNVPEVDHVLGGEGSRGKTTGELSSFILAQMWYNAFCISPKSPEWSVKGAMK